MSRVPTGLDLADAKNRKTKASKLPRPTILISLLAAFVLSCSPAQAQSFAGSLIAWGDNTYGQTNIPNVSTNILAISACGNHSIILNRDGSLIAWGDNASGESNIPDGLTNVVGIAAGYDHNVALNGDGTVYAWGGNLSGETNIPPGLSNVVMVAANGCDCLPNGNHCLALRNDGTVVGWGMQQVITQYHIGNVPAGLTNVASISAGGLHSLALKNDMTVVGWGWNVNGQSTPPQLLTNVVAIAAGGDHSLALRSDGTVFAWGNNAYGQTNVPSGLSNVVAIAAGENFNVALRNDGTVVAWGSNIAGETVVPTGLRNVVAIAVGARHVLAVTNDGSPYVVRQPTSAAAYSGSSLVLNAGIVGAQPISLQWQFNGTNIDGATNATLFLTNIQPGNAGNYALVASNFLSTSITSNALISVKVSVPIIASQPTNYFALFGQPASFVVSAFGSLPLSFHWQHNGTNVANATNAVLSLAEVSLADIGFYSVVVSNSVGASVSSNAMLNLCPIIAWGAGVTNTGLSPNLGQSAIPIGISNALSIAGGGYFSLALLPNGRVLGWGSGSSGQTSPPSTLTNAAAIAAGFVHALALRSNGTVSAWGSPTYGQTAVSSSTTNISAVAAGSYHSLALRSNGTVVAWGAGTVNTGGPHFGQSIVPTNLSNVVAIAAGAYHSAALRSDGSVIAWGLNASGQTNVPPGVTNVVALAAGGSNTVALKADGIVVAWGDNSYGQTNVPADLTNVVAISVGAGHMIALRNDRTLEAWGLDSNGQTNVPLVVSNVISIAAGADHSLALVNTGPITFLYPLQNLTVFKGSNAIFDGMVLGAPPLNYQWLKEGIAIVDATNSSLAFTPAQFTNSGNYQLVASNRFGAVTSSVAVLTVNDTAPFFVAQPGGQSVLQYSNVTLTPVVGGIPPFAYQWQFNGINIAGATNSTLTISNAQPANEGNYSVLVTNTLGSALSSNAFVDVIDIPEALDATNLSWWNSGQPGWRAESTNTHDGFAAAGIALTNSQSDAAGLQTAVTGPGTVTFWCQVPVGTVLLYFNVDGATVTTFAGPSSTWRPFTYYVGTGRHIISWSLGNATIVSVSSKAFLDQVTYVSGSTAPFITSQPLTQSISAGNNVILAAAVGGTPVLAYHWYFNNAPIPGATSSSLTLNNVQSTDTGNYSLMISNAFGSTSSSNATLTVIPSAPTITAQPGGMSLMIGAQATFTATAKGSTPLYYQWLTNGSPISGATNSSLVINNVQYSDGVNYSLLVSNSVGSTASSNAFLFVYSSGDLASTLDSSGITWSTTNVPWFPETNITHDGVSAAQSGVISGTQQSTLQGIATGPATVVYWWKVNCDSFWMNLAFVLNGTVQNAIAGNVDWQPATNYIGAGSQLLQWNLYPVHNAFAGGTGWLDQVQVIPGGTPVSIVSNPANVTNSAGNAVNFSVSVIGTPTFHYQWQFNGADIQDATNAALSLVNVQANDAGTYTVTVTNDFGFTTSSNATLVVNPSGPLTTVQPISQAAVVNSSVTLSVSAKGTTPFTYQWYFNSNALDGATNSSLTFTNVQLTNSGIYYVVISNAFSWGLSLNARLDVNKTRVFDDWAFGYTSYAPPLGLGDITAIAAGSSHSLALRSDGTVIAWGSNAFGQTNIPAGLSNVIAISSGDTHCVALTATGNVVVWGDDRRLQLEMPAGLSNVVAISAGPAYTLALKNDGSLIGWGDDATGQIDIPNDVTNAVAVFAGYYNGFALLADGTMREWGNGPIWQHNGFNTQLNLESSLSNVSAIAASGFTAWSLQADGSASPWGWFDGVGPGPINNAYSSSGGSYTFGGTGADQRPVYSGVVAVASGGNGTPVYDYALLLLNNGSVMQLGGNTFGSFGAIPNVPANSGHAVSVAAGYRHATVLVNDGSPWIVTPTGSRTVRSGGSVTLSAAVVGGSPIGYQWRFNGTNIDGGTNAQLSVNNIALTGGGLYQCIVTNSFGAITNDVLLTVSRSVPQMSLGSFAPGSGPHISIDQLSGHGVTIIYSSTNMSDWKPVFTNPPAVGTIDWVDPSATNGQMRFYRAVEQ